MSKVPGLPRTLKLTRVAAGMSAQQVAEALGVSQQAVSKWERDNSGSSPNDARLDQLAQLYGTTKDALLSRAAHLSQASTSGGSGVLLGPFVPTRQVRDYLATVAKPTTTEPHSPPLHMSADVEQAERVAELWASAHDCLKGMGETLARVRDTLPEADALLAHKELVARADIMFDYTARLARRKPISVQTVERVQSVSVINQILFAEWAEPNGERLALSAEEQNSWIDKFSLGHRRASLVGMRVVFDHPTHGIAELRDEENRLASYFDRRP